MWKCYAKLAGGPQPVWTRDRWCRLAEEILLLAAFGMTSSWLIRL
jgi:hypothetical protein